MLSASATSIAFLCTSISLDVAANYFLKVSDGFKHKLPGFFAICLVAAAFLCLGQSVKTLELSVAYATWGAGGIVGTLLIDRYFFDEKIGHRSMLGVPLLIAGIAILQMSQ